jgi:hypothetical protein
MQQELRTFSARVGLALKGSKKPMDVEKCLFRPQRRVEFQEKYSELSFNL